MAWVVAVNVIAYERETPVKRPHQAIVVSLVSGVFATVHECFPQNLNKTSLLFAAAQRRRAILKAWVGEIKLAKNQGRPNVLRAASVL
jgi:hypothetical protein